MLDGSQRQLFRELKESSFDLVLEVQRNEAGYNVRDVHGQLVVIQNTLPAKISAVSNSSCKEADFCKLVTSGETGVKKKVGFKLHENRVECFEHVAL
mmetsp:Transcript_9684/g.14742  ORF Transcript_9684/g.14742 Transcript_9684/m.14742 type:complete len:97 (-) Transcript_9684:58-348(-)